MARIISLTGLSGVGKTTIAKMLIAEHPEASLVVSYTTRKPRHTDTPGEYAYISDEAFAAKEAEGAFLWTAERRGVRYGTIAEDVRIAVNHPTRFGIMILVSETVEKLRDFLQREGRLDAHVPIFIAPPPKEILLAWLKSRGDSHEEIERRLKDDEVGEALLRETKIPFHVVHNNGNSKEAFHKIEKLIF